MVISFHPFVVIFKLLCHLYASCSSVTIEHVIDTAYDLSAVADFCYHGCSGVALV